MEKLSLADQVQQYAGCLVQYKDEIVLVLDVTGKGFHIRYAKDKSEVLVPFEYDKFKPIETRLGFINEQGVVLQAERSPCRRYHVGLCSRNVQVNHSVCKNNSNVDRVGLAVLLTTDFSHPAFIKTVKNEYPPFKTALEEANDLKGAVAFNRQLALDYRGNAVYRDKIVGTVIKGAKSAMDIVFGKNFSYLTTLTRTL